MSDPTARKDEFRRGLQEALNRAGHTVTTRASQGAVEPSSPTGGPEGADGGDEVAAGRTEARPVDLAFAALGQWFHGPDYTATGHANNPGECDPCWDSAEIASIAIALGTSDITKIREHMEGGQ